MLLYDLMLVNLVEIWQRVDDILQFIADFTVHVEGVGHVCRSLFSSFSLKQYLAGFCLFFVKTFTAINMLLSLAVDNLQIGCLFTFCVFCFMFWQF